MADTINFGWLTDYQGNKFAPKTVASQILNNDGSSYQEQIASEINKKPGRLVEGETFTWDGSDQIAGNGAEIFNHLKDSSSDPTGYNHNIAIGQWSHAEGTTNAAIGMATHVEGAGNLAEGECSHAEGTTTIAEGECSHAEGISATASGKSSHAEGYNTIAKGDCSHSEGRNAKATGFSSHAENQLTTAEGSSSHAEGYNTTAKGNYSHAEGYGPYASGQGSHAEGKGTVASGYYSHTEGEGAQTLGKGAHAEGYATRGNGDYSHAEGYLSYANRNYSHAEGYYTIVEGESSHAEGNGINDTITITYEDGSLKEISDEQRVIASGKGSHAEGHATIASGQGSHAEGYSEKLNKVSYRTGDNSYTMVYLTSPVSATGKGAHAEGVSSSATGEGSHAEGYNTGATKIGAHAEGYKTTANGNYSHAEGYLTTADSGNGAHAEGISTTASGKSSHAEGNYTEADGDYSHAEGFMTQASGLSSHAEGESTAALGDGSHAEGRFTEATGHYSHAEGEGTVAASAIQHVEGKYNKIDEDQKYAHIVGNGFNLNERFNAHTLDWNGNAWYAGYIYSGGEEQSNSVPINGVISAIYSPSDFRYVHQEFNQPYSYRTIISDRNLAESMINSARREARSIGTDIFYNFLYENEQNYDNNIYEIKPYRNIILDNEVSRIQESNFDEYGIPNRYEVIFDCVIRVNAELDIIKLSHFSISQTVSPKSIFYMKFVGEKLNRSQKNEILINGQWCKIYNNQGVYLFADNNAYTEDDIFNCYYDGSTIRAINTKERENLVTYQESEYIIQESNEDIYDNINFQLKYNNVTLSNGDKLLDVMDFTNISFYSSKVIANKTQVYLIGANKVENLLPTVKSLSVVNEEIQSTEDIITVDSLDDFNYYFNDDILYLFHKGQYWIYNFQSGNNISIIHDYYPSSEINSWYLMKNKCGATARRTLGKDSTSYLSSENILLVNPSDAANKLIKLNTFDNRYRDVIYNNKYIMMISDNEEVSFLMLKDYAVEKASLVTHSNLCTASGNYTTLGVIGDKFIAFEDYSNRVYYRIISLVGEESGVIAASVSDEKVNSDVTLSAPIFAQVIHNKLFFFDSNKHMWCYNEESEDLSSISLECTIDYRCFYEQDNKTFAVDTTGMCYTPREKISVNTLNLKDITKNITLGMKIKTGSYLGTGTAGAASPNILTFDFTPVLLIIAPESGNSSNIDTNEAIFFIGRKNYYRHWYYSGSNTDSLLQINFDLNSVSWYQSDYTNDIGAHIQYNSNNKKYTYVAIGI